MLLRHKQETQLAHGALSLADGFLHQLDAPFGFFDWPLKRVTVLADHHQQLLAQALEAAVASGANEISARVFNEAMQARQQFFPIPQRTAVFHPLGGTHLKDLAHRAMQPLFQNLARELGRRRALRIAGPVGLIDDQDQIPNLLANGLHQRQLLARNGRIGSDHDQCRIDVRDECLRGGRVSGEDRAQARRVDKTHAGGQQRAGHEDFRAVQGLFVFGVEFFGDIFLQGGEGNVLPGAVPHANARARFAAKPDHRRHCGDRNKPRGDNCLANQSVEQGGFAALKLADTSYIEAAFGDPRSELPCFLGDRLGPKFLCQICRAATDARSRRSARASHPEGRRNPALSNYSCVPASVDTLS